MALVTGFVSQGMPLGVFAIVASAAGTMDLEELRRLQVYLVTCTAMALFLTLGAPRPHHQSHAAHLPAGRRADAGYPGDGLCDRECPDPVTLLIQRSKALLRASASSTADTEATVEVIVPAFTRFPKIGTLFPMSFVLFAGWFAGTPVAVAGLSRPPGNGPGELVWQCQHGPPPVARPGAYPGRSVPASPVINVVTSRCGDAAHDYD